MITADSKDFNALINSLKSSESAETGLMVGYKYQDKYYIYFTSKTPASEVSNKSLSTLLSTSLSIPGATYSDWAVQHAKEVARFLPGGLGILGTYSVSEEDLRLENFAYMPNAVLKLYSDITNEITLEDTLLVLHYNLLENKYCTGVVDIKVFSI
jgi:Odorant response abnormal 4-like